VIRKNESAELYPPVAPQSFGLGLEEDERKSSDQGDIFVFLVVGWIDIHIDIYIFFCFLFCLVLIFEKFVFSTLTRRR